MSVSKETKEFIQKRPLIKECLKKGVINYSALARLISAESKLGEKNFDAVLVACRREAEKIKTSPNTEKKIMALLKNSRLEIKNKVAACVISPGAGVSRVAELAKETNAGESFHVMQGTDHITLICQEQTAKKVASRLKQFMIEKTDGLAQVNIKTGKEIERIPGVVSFLYSLLAEHGINVVETMSAWTDTMFIVQEKDVPKIMEVLKFS